MVLYCNHITYYVIFNFYKIFKLAIFSIFHGTNIVDSSSSNLNDDSSKFFFFFNVNSSNNIDTGLILKYNYSIMSSLKFRKLVWVGDDFGLYNSVALFNNFNFKICDMGFVSNASPMTK